MSRVLFNCKFVSNFPTISLEVGLHQTEKRSLMSKNQRNNSIAENWWRYAHFLRMRISEKKEFSEKSR